MQFKTRKGAAKAPFLVLLVVMGGISKM